MTVLKLGATVVDLASHQLQRAGQVSRLTAMEVALLRYLAERPGQAISHDELLQQVWGYKPGLASRAVFHAVTRLKKKLEDDPNEPRYLCSVYGVGYALHVPSEASAELIGRERELERLSDGARLITLIGPGGVGKTALARAYAAQTGASWVDLSAVRGPDELVAAVAAALGLPVEKDPEKAVDSFLSRRPMTLVLDGFEHLVGCAPLIERWARTSRWVVTSREALQVPGEHRLPVEPLPVPVPGATDEEVAACPSVRLFLRAAARVSAAPTALQEVAAIVRALDGLPLALELAAARLRAMTPRDLCQRLSQLDLRQTIAWSWELLSLPHRRALASVAVFAGAFSLDEAEAILELGELPAAHLLEALVDRSLLRVTPAPEGARYSLLGAIRAFVREQREVVDPQALGERHATWFARYGTPKAEDELFGPDSEPRLRALGARYPELVAAAEWAWANHRVELARDTALAVAQVAWSRGPYTPALQLLERAERLAPHPRLTLALGRLGECVGDGRAEARLTELVEHPELGGLASTDLGLLLHRQGRTAEAEVHLHRAVELLAGRPYRQLVARHHLARVLRVRGQTEAARREVTRALALLGSGGESHRLYGGLQVELGGLLVLEGRLSRARRVLERAQKYLQSAGHRRLEALALGQLGVVAMLCGDWQLAAEYIQAQLEVQLLIGDRRVEAIARMNLGIIQAELGQAEAEDTLETALALHREVGDRRGEGYTLVNLGHQLRELGELHRSRTLLEQAVAIGLETRVERLLGAALGALASTQLALDELAEAWSSLERAEHHLRTSGDEVQLAITLCTRGRVRLAQGEPEQAQEALQQAEQLAARLGVQGQAPVSRAVGGLRNALQGVGKSSMEA